MSTSGPSADRGVACIGVDVGGTFTDAVLSDGVGLWRAKAPSTPGNLGVGVVAACRLVAARSGTTLEELMPRVERFGLGTTAVTNTIASRTGRRVGLVTTAGFEDLVPIARGIRVASDGWLVPPVPLVDRECIVGVPERRDRSGAVLRPLDLTAVTAAADHLVSAQRVEAIVVSFLWAHIDDAHERLALDAIRGRHPKLIVVSAASLLPTIREYDRTQFALLNAYTSGALAGVDGLARQLAELGLRHPPLLVHSGGGSISIPEGHQVPATLAESGPAAGVVAALAVCQATGVADAVVGDVGGTSFDVSVITDGQPGRRSRGELMGVWTALPMLDINSVGSGGGSIAWFDPLGILRVGPQSAGANPGPACYERGGAAATVTDALVVLGYIDPANFLGGDMRLDPDAARQACAALGGPAGLDAEQAAWGIWEVAKASMCRALRARFAERGLDHRRYAVVSIGGCGSLFTAAIAQQLGMSRVLVPQLASVFSAFGAATSQVRRERSQSVGAVIPADPDRLREVVNGLAAAVAKDLEADGIGHGHGSVSVSAEMRFARQRFELPMAWHGDLDESGQLAMRERFVSEYTARYGKGATVSGAPVEIAALSAVGVGETVRAVLAPVPVTATGPAPTAGARTILGDPGQPPTQAAVVLGDAIEPGHTVTGPALIDASDTTVWIPAGASMTMDGYRTIDIRIAR
jgi:N-methylhydantoinase A